MKITRCVLPGKRPSTKLLFNSLFSLTILLSFNLFAEDVNLKETEQTAISPEQLFNTVGGYGCIACHGKYAHGGGYVGGNIRGTTREKLDVALETQPTMLLLAEVLDENKRNALIDHLASLAEMQLLEWRIGESTTTKTVKAKAGHRVQLVLFNGTFDTLSLDLSAIGAVNNFQINALDTQAITWTPKAGRYPLSFNNEHFIIDVN